MRYLLLFLLSGCAANQSALPMQPEFSPAEDAPIFIGQPGSVAPEPEKSPHHRLLPQTPASRREAGIWAGDEPRAMAGREPKIGGVLIALPLDQLKRQPRPTPCVGTMDDILARLGLKERMENIQDARVRQCLAARLYRYCVDKGADEDRRDLAKQYRREVTSGLRRKNVPLDTTPTDAERAAAALEARDCGGGLDSDAADILRRATAEFSSGVRIGR